MIREGLAAQISNDPDLELCGEAEDVEKAIPSITAAKPDLVIVDISSGADVIEHLKTSAPTTAILVWSLRTEQVYVQHAMAAGARGFLSKRQSALEIIKAIHTVLGGGIYLSSDLAEKFGGRSRSQTDA